MPYGNKRTPADDYPTGFLTSRGCVFKRSRKHVSADGTPRYVPNPNSPDNTYYLGDLAKDPNYKPLY